MAIIKFLNDRADFTSVNATETAGTIFDVNRMNGWTISSGGSMAAVWGDVAGNDFWFHSILGYTSSSAGWDTVLMRFYDEDSNIVFEHGSFDAKPRFSLYGDSGVSFEYPILINVPLVTDVHLERIGTTSLTLTVYINGALQNTLTVTNAVNKKLPVRMEAVSFDDNGVFRWGETVVADEDTRGWRITQLKPTAFGGDQAWDGAASSVVDGSLLTGISTDVVDARASFGISRLESLDDDALIDRVCIQTYSQRGATGPTAFNHYFRYDGGAIEDDTDNALAETVDYFVDEYALDPNTGLVWDPVTMQGMQIGVRART